MTEEGRESSSSLFEEMIAACGATDEGKELLGRIYRLVQSDLIQFNQSQMRKPVHDFWLTNFQIREILKAIPSIFPEDWSNASASPPERFTEYQKEYLKRVFAMPQGGLPCTPKAVEFIIKRGVRFRNECRIGFPGSLPNSQ